MLGGGRSEEGGMLGVDKPEGGVLLVLLASGSTVGWTVASSEEGVVLAIEGIALVNVAVNGPGFCMSVSASASSSSCSELELMPSGADPPRQ
jgi:hypothetical protein